jgi:Uma2 family endonuclease
MKEMKQEEIYHTYKEYATWDNDVRYELDDGVAYALAAPLINHQMILLELATQLKDFLKGSPCKVIISPIDVRLNADKNDDLVYQPDLIVVCDKSKIADGKSCKGAPDLVIEITSPSTMSIDKVVKYNRYLNAGVKEYWIVDPDSKTVNVFVLKDNAYVSYAYGEKDILSSHILKGCEINLTEVFI